MARKPAPPRPAKNQIGPPISPKGNAPRRMGVSKKK